MSQPIDFSFKPEVQTHVAQAAGDMRDLVRLSYQNQIEAKAAEYGEKAAPEEAESATTKTKALSSKTKA